MVSFSLFAQSFKVLNDQFLQTPSTNYLSPFSELQKDVEYRMTFRTIFTEIGTLFPFWQLAKKGSHNFKSRCTVATWDKLNLCIALHAESTDCMKFSRSCFETPLRELQLESITQKPAQSFYFQAYLSIYSSIVRKSL